MQVRGSVLRINSETRALTVFVTVEALSIPSLFLMDLN